MTIIDALNSADIFRPLFKNPETWRAWQVYLSALFGLPVEGKEERKILRACTGLKSSSMDKKIKESFVICGRRSGKSYISAVISTYLAAFKDWKPFLSPGEKGWIFIIANDKSQARIVKDYISGIFNSIQTLKGLVENDLTWELQLKNGVNIAVKTSNFRTLRGFTLLACVLEEISFYRSEESANPDREILGAVRPALATIPESLLLGISTPYSRAGVLYEQFKKYFGKSGGPLIWRAPTSIMNPTIDKEIIKTALKEDPAAALAEWEAEFRTDIEAFMPLEFIEGATIPGRYELAKEQARNNYVAFVDPSGGRQDSFTLAISHKDETGKVILDVLRERRPPFQPKIVVIEFSEVLKNYGIHSAGSDFYAAEWVRESFRDNGIFIKNSEFTASEIYLRFLPLMANGSVELLENKRLKVQLAGLERRVRPGGKDLVTHYGGHDDCANAVAGACVEAGKEQVGPRIWSTKDLLDEHTEKRQVTFDRDYSDEELLDILEGNGKGN
jgi:hypothetical protein